jgi:hypothetical protein
VNYKTEITIAGEKVVVEWHTGRDPEDNDDLIISVTPDVHLNTFGEAILLYWCKIKEQEIAEDRKTERKLE